MIQTIERPVALYREAKSEYRMRCLRWLLETHEPFQIEGLLTKYRQRFPKDKIVKETLYRSLQIMEKRNWACRTRLSGEDVDGRGILWSAAE